MKSMKKLGMYNSGPICQYPRAYLGFHIPKGFIGSRTTAISYNPTKWLPQNCVLSLAVHGITCNTGGKCKKIVPTNMLAGPKGGKWLANPPNPPHLDPLLRTPFQLMYWCLIYLSREIQTTHITTYFNCGPFFSQSFHHKHWCCSRYHYGAWDFELPCWISCC